MQYTSSPVKAAISGTVTSLPVQVGSTVSQQVPVAQISDMNELEIQVDVAEKFISRMKVGLPVEIGFDAYPGRIFEGRVKELSPVLDPIARTLEVKIAIDNGGNLLKSGMFAEVKIITEEKENILKIPAECMVERFGESFVFIVERNSGDDVGTAYKRSITPGIEVDNKLEVRDGISAGMEVVYRGQTLLDDGSKVRVVEEIPPLSGDDVLE